MEKVKDYNNNRAKLFNNYSGTSEKKPLRYGQDSFVKELIQKNVTIELVNGKILIGKLIQLGMFDILIEIKSTENYIVSGKPMVRDVIKNLIILKSAIISVEVVKQ